MKLTIEINLDNAAFEDESEVFRIVSHVGEVVEYRPGWTKTLRDLNGNTVGTAVVTD